VPAALVVLDLLVVVGLLVVVAPVVVVGLEVVVALVVVVGRAVVVFAGGLYPELIVIVIVPSFIEYLSPTPAVDTILFHF